jgi:hypothetical protein
MKKSLLLLLSICIIFYGCNNPHNKAENLIKKYLKENLKDPDSYDCFSKGDLKIYTPMAMALQHENERIHKGIASADTLNSFVNHIYEYFKDNGTNPYDTLAWELSLKYRAKNSYGGYVIEHVLYYFNKDITKIIDVKRQN